LRIGNETVRQQGNRDEILYKHRKNNRKDSDQSKVHDSELQQKISRECDSGINSGNSETKRDEKNETLKKCQVASKPN
jgi:hypothetical protein